MIYAYKIEGFMCPDTGELFRISTGIPEFLPQAERELFIDALTMKSVTPRAEKVDWSKSKTSFTSTTFEVVTSAGLPDRLRYFWLRTDAVPVANLAGAANATQTSLTVDTSGLDDTVVYMGNEAIKLGTWDGVGQYDGCIRGYGETPPQSHAAGGDTTMYATMHPQTFRQRRVTYCEIPEESTLLSSETDIFPYALNDLTWGSFNSFKMECLSAMTVLMESRPSVNFATGKCEFGYSNEFGPNRITDYIKLDVDPDTGEEKQLVNPTNPIFLLGDGEYAYEGIYQEDAWGIGISRGQPLYQSVVVGTDELYGPAFEVLIALPGIGVLGYDDGEYYGDIITILLNVWMSTKHGNNGPFDIGIDCGIRMGQQFFDLDACRQLRDTLGNELAAPLYVLKPAESVKSALKEAEAFLQAHQVALVTGKSGRLTFARPFDSGTVYQEVVDIDLDSILYEDMGRVVDVSSRMGLPSMVSQVVCKYNDVPGSKAATVTVTDSRFDDRSMGRAAKVKLDMGVTSSLEQAYTVAYNWEFRWRGVVPTCTFKVKRDAGLRLPNGSSVLLSHPNLPTWISSGGYIAAGAKNLAAVISSRRESNRHFEYDAMLIGLRFDRVAPRAPAMLVTSYDPNETVFVELNHFITDRHPVYTYDIDAFEDGDVVQILTSDGTQRTASTFPISITDTNEFELVGAAVDLGIVAGDVIVFAPYTDVTASQKLRGVFQAGSGGTVEDDRGYQWQG